MKRKRIIDLFYIRKTIDSYTRPVVTPDLEGEDGGPGSGNWGHKGRPGFVGGSGNGKEGWTAGAGKGHGGSQYRGGRSDIGEYFGSKRDWLNGLNGERQHEVQKWMQTKGSNIREQEKNILTGGMNDITTFLKAKTEARKITGWDDTLRKLAKSNLEPHEQIALFNAYKNGEGASNDLVDRLLYGAESKEDMRKVANIMNKLMGGESYLEQSSEGGSGEPKKPPEVPAGPQFPPPQNNGELYKQLAARGAYARSIGKDPDYTQTTFGQAVGEKHMRNLMRKVAECPDKTAVALWDALVQTIRVRSTTNPGQCYKPFFNAIEIDVEGNEKGSSYEAPLETTFHEAGHMMDAMLTVSEATAGFVSSMTSKHFSHEYKDGLFAKTIEAEMGKLVKLAEDEVVADYQSHIDDLDYLLKNDYLSYWEYLDAKSGQAKLRKKPLAASLRPKATAKLRKILEEKSPTSDGLTNGRHYSSFSDMLEGATKQAYSLGYGHEKGYYSGDRGREKAATEAFTEIFAAAITQRDGAYKWFETFLPETLKVWHEMIDETLA